MTRFSAHYFDGKSSRSHGVTATLSGDTLSLSGDGINLDGIPLSNCQIPPALGDTTRAIQLPKGGRLETDNLNALLELESRLGANRGMRLVNRLESHWRAVLLCFTGLILCTWLFISHGIPFIAEKAAEAIPPLLTEKISVETLKMLDEHYLAPSALDETRLEELRVLFGSLVAGKEKKFSYSLEFREGKLIGANAFALPSGLVLMTDELVELAERDEELVGILAHEIVHVERRHGIRSVFQNAGVFLLVSIIAGDVASITSVASTLPTLLAQTGYSRRFEREADEGAGRYMIGQGGGTKPLRDILERLTSTHGGTDAPSFLSTHPGTTERIKFLQALQG